MIDETYTLREPGDDSEVLLTTNNPKSGKVLAWARTFRESRVFCYQSGHDASAFANPHFRRVLERGIAWAARRGLISTTKGTKVYEGKKSEARSQETANIAGVNPRATRPYGPGLRHPKP
jgi:hypothetical protein